MARSKVIAGIRPRHLPATSLTARPPKMRRVTKGSQKDRCKKILHR
jgi:hypothetical protein